MPLHLDRDYVVIASVPVPYTSFPALVQCHLDNVRLTREIERQGAAVRDAGFPDHETDQFIRAVCIWGGRAGVWGQVRNGNSAAMIRQRLMTALGALDAASPDAAEAVRQVDSLHGLAISFGSKQLRFLRPDVCPVLDSVISGRLGYSLDHRSYSHYTSDTLAIATRLECLRFVNPMRRDGGRWFAADVDMALFAYLQTSRGARGWHGGIGFVPEAPRSPKPASGQSTGARPMTPPDQSEIRFARLIDSYKWRPGTIIRVVRDDGVHKLVGVEWHPEDNGGGDKVWEWPLRRSNMEPLD